jgi:putative transposase
MLPGSRKAVAAEIKAIYRADTAELALERLEEFDQSAWGRKYPAIAASWRRHWERVTAFFAYPPDVRRVLYTTNAIESLNMRLRKIIKNRSHFPSDEAATKLIYLALRSIMGVWARPTRDWKAAMAQFAILLPERLAAIA